MAYDYNSSRGATLGSGILWFFLKILIAIFLFNIIAVSTVFAFDGASELEGKQRAVSEITGLSEKTLAPADIELKRGNAEAPVISEINEARALGNNTQLLLENNGKGRLLLIDGAASQQQLITRYQSLLKLNNRKLLWFEDGELTAAGNWLQEIAFDIGIINADMLNIRQWSAERSDLLLTSALLQIVNFRWQHGQLTHKQLDGIISALLVKSANQRLSQLLIPSFPQLVLLRQSIKQYQSLATKVWPALSLSFEPKLGQQHFEIYKIRQILTELGDLPRKYQSQKRLDVFDQVAINSVKRFQKRHGLIADGRIGSKTLAALQITPQQRLEQLQVNFWRWLKLPTVAPENYLLVNIPDYRLHMQEGENAVFEMRVIVGDKENQTPEMVSTIAGLTFNPTWTPPPKIIKNELMPQYQQDYRNLASKKFKLVQGYWRYSDVVEIDSADMDIKNWLKTHRLVQMPGKTNPLGAFRFNIPNDQAIYLHDTPAKHLFRNQSRALSHGCVRIEQPKKLASYLIERANRPLETELEKIVAKGTTRTVNIAKPLPIYIGYHTAWVSDTGELRLFEDVYGLDQGNLINKDLARLLIINKHSQFTVAGDSEQVLSP